LIAGAAALLLHGSGKTLGSAAANPCTSSLIPLSPMSLVALSYSASDNHYHFGFLKPFRGYANFWRLHGFGKTLLSATTKP